MPQKKTTLRTGKNSHTAKHIFVGVFLVVLIGFVGSFILHKLGITVPSLTTFGKPVVQKSLVADVAKSRQFVVDKKGGTLHFYDSRKVLITIYVPPNAVPVKQVFSVAPIKAEDATQTGVSIVPDAYKFKQPISISFDFSKSDLKNDAPSKLLEDTVRQTGSTHVYAFNTENKNMTPILISRGVESASYLSARTLASGVYYVKVKDKDELYYARQTVKDPASHYDSLLEAGATLLFNGQQLTSEEQKRVKDAIATIMNKSNPPLYELYAAMVLQKKLDAKATSFVSKAYAWDSALPTQLEKTCKEETHSLETYIVSSMLADINGLTFVSQQCKATVKSVVPKRVAEIVSNPNASFEQVVTMLSQVIALEGAQSQYVAQLQEKLQKVVERDVDEATGPTGNAQMRKLVVGEMDFANVEPSLKAKLESVQATDANKELDILLANACPTKAELEWGKVIAVQYNLNDYVTKIQKKLDNFAECKTVTGKGKPGDPPPPVQPGGGAVAPPTEPGECVYIYDYAYESDFDQKYNCKYCYEVMTDDVNYTTKYEDCSVAFSYDACRATLNLLQQRECDFSHLPAETIDSYTEDPELVPPNYGEDPALSDPYQKNDGYDGQNNTNDESSKNDQTDSQDQSEGSYSGLDMPLAE